MIACLCGGIGEAAAVAGLVALAGATREVVRRRRRGKTERMEQEGQKGSEAEQAALAQGDRGPEHE